MKNLIILQTATPDYRKKFFQFLKIELGSKFRLFRGDYYFEKSIKTDKSIKFGEKLNNHFLLNRKFLFQTGIFWKYVFKNNIMVLEMNPRILSNWLILFIRRILIKHTVLWGHAWPRRGSNSKSDFLRNIMRLLGNEIIVYTHSQKLELRKKMPRKKIHAASNAIYLKQEMISVSNQNINNIIYVGRLTRVKKPLLLVKAFNKVLEKLPEHSRLLIIGEGEEKNSIIDFINAKGINHRVDVLGHIFFYNKLKKYYNSSLVSVSPGYVGLSVTQSLSFGVPMIVSRNENHSPEIEAVKEGFNALFFETDKVASMAEEIINFFQNKDFWINQRGLICDDCKKSYSVEAMVGPFLRLMNN